MLKVLSKQKRTFFRNIVIIFFVLSLLFLSSTTFIKYNANQVKKEELLNNEQNLLRAENTIISNRINRISDDLMYLVDTFEFNYKNNSNYSEIEKQWISFSNRKMIYDQIRFIDIQGQEIIRVNKTKDGASFVNREDCQNKSDRYYFKDTIELEENQIYISKLDLNVEKEEIEEPIKPMIRISTPYYDKKDLKGIIILNYSAIDMLNQIDEISSMSNGNIYMLNTDGYWLYNSHDKDKEWTFMYEDKLQVNFRNEYPVEWQNMKNRVEEYEITENGVFVNRTVGIKDLIFTENHKDSYVFDLGNWTLISHMMTNSENGILFTQSFWSIPLEVMKSFYYVYIMILLISIIISALIAINKNEKEKIRYFSEFDAMTGVYNRRVGLERLTELYNKSKRGSKVSSICYLDINGLKEVNDNLGHKAGDELIKSVINGIRKNIRGNDIVARLGGDEFLIVFEGVGKGKSEEIWERIKSYYSRINESEDRDYIISVSHGIEEFKFKTGEQIHEILNRADEKMYEEKETMKKNLEILKNRENIKE